MEEEGEREENIVRFFISEELLECWWWCIDLQMEFHFLQRSETETEFWGTKENNIMAKEKLVLEYFYKCWAM